VYSPNILNECLQQFKENPTKKCIHISNIYQLSSSNEACFPPQETFELLISDKDISQLCRFPENHLNFSELCKKVMIMKTSMSMKLSNDKKLFVFPLFFVEMNALNFIKLHPELNHTREHLIEWLKEYPEIVESNKMILDYIKNQPKTKQLVWNDENF